MDSVSEMFKKCEIERQNEDQSELTFTAATALTSLGDSSLLKAPKEEKLDDSIEEIDADKDDLVSFPQRLMEILSNEEHSDTILWLPHGRGFIILKKNKFASEVLPCYFKKSKYTSFTRKLIRWGFYRVTRGPETGSYYHNLFRRGDLKLCMQMSCQKTNHKIPKNVCHMQVSAGMPGNLSHMARPIPIAFTSNFLGRPTSHPRSLHVQATNLFSMNMSTPAFSNQNFAAVADPYTASVVNAAINTLRRSNINETYMKSLQVRMGVLGTHNRMMDMGIIGTHNRMIDQNKQHPTTSIHQQSKTQTPLLNCQKTIEKPSASATPILNSVSNAKSITPPFRAPKPDMSKSKPKISRAHAA